MEGMKLLGLLVLSVFSVSVAGLGYFALSSLTERQRLAGAVERLAAACREVAYSGGERVVELEIPGDRTIAFQDNYILADGLKCPEGGLPLPFAENSQPLSGGRQTVRISVSAGRLVVWTS